MKVWLKGGSVRLQGILQQVLVVWVQVPSLPLKKMKRATLWLVFFESNTSSWLAMSVLCQWLVGSRWIASSTWSGPQAPRRTEGYQVTVSDWTFYSPAPEISVASQVEYKLDRIILCTYTYTYIYILYYIVYIVYIYIILCIYIHIYYIIIYIYIFVLEVYSCSKLAAAERYNVPEGKKIFVLEVYSGNTLCWRVGIRLICMKPHGFGLIHARHKSFTEWCYT